MNQLISNSEYAEFLNSVARDVDAKGLWNPLMQDHFWGGVLRAQVEKTGPSFTEATVGKGDGERNWRYSVKPGYEKLPVTCVTWTAAIRYCNWLSYGKPTGDEVLGVTEGDEQYGAYDTRQIDGEEFVRGQMPIKRNSNAPFYLPTAEEWRAWRFVEGYEKLAANVYDGHWARPFPHLVSVEDDVRGNVGEWVESRRPNSNFFMALGGSVIRGPYSLKKDFIEGDECNRAISSFGFRVFGDGGVLNRVEHVDRVDLDRSRETSKDDVKWVRIGYAGNLRDPLYKVGRVDYEFEMARYALTNAEWCEFLNAVACESDPHGLYNPDMGTGVCSGIEKVEKKIGPSFAEATEGRGDGQRNWEYLIKPGWEKRPVVYVGFTDVCRYCNWLTSGDTERGSYDMSGRVPKRVAGAKYVVPTDDEWCKAAYFDPTRLGVRKYWDYPCRTDDLPSNDPTQLHACNYLKDGMHLGEKGPFYLAEVDAYPTSDTFFGCRQMAGNVWEWVEPVSSAKLNLRGTSFGYTEFGMGIWNRDEAGFDDELYVFGARLARLLENPKWGKPSWKTRFREWVIDHL